MTLALTGCEPSTTMPLEEELSCCDRCGGTIISDPIELPDGCFACDAGCAEALGFILCHDCGAWNSREEPYHDPEGNPVCIACFDSNYRSCDACGKITFVESAHWIECQGKIVCHECRRDQYTLCLGCGELFPGSETYYVESQDAYVCQSCKDSDYAYCSRCELLFHYERMEGTYCDECTRDSDDERIQDYCYKPYYKFLQTESDTAEHRLYFGFELEIEVDSSISDACDAVEEFSYLYMKSDSSIDHGFEIVSHPGTLHYWQQEQHAITNLLQKLLSQGCDAEAQGLHVHISKGLMQENHRIRFQSFFDANKELMFQIARRRDCGYSKHKDLSHCDWKNAANNPDRYQAVNWQNPRTVEIRMFRGTLKIVEFMASIEFCHAVYLFTKNQISLATIANSNSWQPFCEFIKNDKRYPALKAYLADLGLLEAR